MSLTSELREHAQAAGIDLIGVASAKPFLVGEERREVDPREYLPGAQAIVVTACYVFLGQENVPPSAPGRPLGRIGMSPGARHRAARYYSERIVSEFLASSGYEAVISNKVPFKMAAVRSGIASYGKNCLVHADGFGSFIELACIITDAPLESADGPAERSDCGNCTACMEACPTGALDGPYRFARNLCMSYWLGVGAPIPPEFRETIGDSILRCDLCRRVCPRNRGLLPREDAPFEVDSHDPPDLIPLLLGDADYYRKVLPGFDEYASVDVVHRNVAIALGNIGDPAAVPALVQASGSDLPEVREAALWALDKIMGQDG
jgi:epoxyqueuosine reductase